MAGNHGTLVCLDDPSMTLQIVPGSRVLVTQSTPNQTNNLWKDGLSYLAGGNRAAHGARAESTKAARSRCLHSTFSTQYSASTVGKLVLAPNNCV